MEETKIDGLPSAADLDAVESEKQIAADAASAPVAQTTADFDDTLELQEIDPEAEFESVYVTRAEFNELLARIAKYNIGAPHKL